MFLSFFLFEIKLRLRRISTYIYFLLPFLVTFFSVSVSDFGPIGTGKVFLNGPYALQQYFGQLTGFGSLIISAIFGTSILRDFQQDTYQLVFTKPVSKFAYLGGRWAGSMVVATLCFTGMVWGCIAGSLMPWADPARLAPFNPWWYLQTFFSVSVVEIFFLGSIYFMVAALTRRVVVVYVQGVALFSVYMIGAIYTLSHRTADPFWPSVFDPLGMVLMATVTRYWTVAEQNSHLLNWTGSFLYNRLFWSTAGLASLAAAFRFFPMSVEQLTARRPRPGSRRNSEDTADRQPFQHRRHLHLPRVSRTFGGAGTCLQLLSLTRSRFWNIVREIPFWAITILMVVLAVLDGKEAGRIRGTAVWPVTYLMTQVLHDSSSLFFYMVGTLYAGELIWRERDVRFEQIHDSLPLDTWANWVSQFLSLALVEFILITTVMACGVALQASMGYYNFEIALYMKELYLVVYPGILGFLMFALFAQTLVSNKFVGHAIVIGLYLLAPMLERYGIENHLLLFGETAPYTYSDMNGYGHFVPALLWSNVYWFFLMALLSVVAIAFARRGTDLGRRTRWSQGRVKLRQLSIAAILCASIVVASGGWYYYNGHVLNELRTSKQARESQAAYERNFKKYERSPQPKITAVDTVVDIDPQHRSFTARSSYALVNRTDQPISEVHLSDPRESASEVTFDRSFHLKLASVNHSSYSIYKLDQPLRPGETMRMDFRSSYIPQGFKDGGERPEFAYNGTFFDRDYFPFIGYSRNGELTDPVRRREENLPPREETPSPGNLYYRDINFLTPDSEPILFHAFLSTSADQIAVAPGYLKRQWTKDGRRYFEYDTGAVRMALLQIASCSCRHRKAC